MLGARAGENDLDDSPWEVTHLHTHHDRLLATQAEQKLKAEKYGEELLLIQDGMQCAVDHTDAAEAALMTYKGPQSS